MFKSLYLLNLWMDLVDILPDVRYWSEVLYCIILTTWPHQSPCQGQGLWNFKVFFTPPPPFPQNIVLVGYTVFSMSVILWFHQFYGIYFITLIAFVRFCSNLHHTLTIRQCMFDRKIGAAGSVLQVMPLCNSYNKMFVLSPIVIPSTFKGFAL